MLAKTSPSDDTLILNALDVGIVILDRQGRIVLWNDWIARYTQTAASAVAGKTLVDVFPTLAATRLPSAVEDSFETGSSGLLTHSLNKLFPMHNEGGQELLHNVIVRPISSGPSQQCLLQVNDVTVAVTRERVLRERQNARYRAIVDTAPDAIITINLDLSIQWLNGTAAQILGYAPDELVGQTIDVLLENENDLTTSFLKVAQQDGQIGGALQIVGRRKDGVLIPFEMSLARWSVDDRIFVTTIWRDITDRMLAETALRESEARLRRNNEELETRVAERTHEREVALAQLFESQKLETIGQLTGGVAHDFNNLLSVILGSLSLLRKRIPDDPRIIRLVDGAIQGAERGATLTKRLLAFARRQDLKLEASELQTLVPGMADFLRQSVGPGIQITFDIPDDTDPVMTDINQLELALMNLAVNARDAMPQGGKLTISSRNEKADGARRTAGLRPGEYVRLSVADTGDGMDEATLARALEPFFTTKGVGKGTGLGLSMVHGLTAQSGGAMDIASKVGEGTVISLWLPRGKREDVARDVPAPAVPVASRPLRILLVDDDVLVSMNTVNMLTDLGHDVVEAQSALKALQLLETDGPFEVVVTDYAMPGMNGLDFANEAKSRYPDMFIILATGYAELPTNAAVDFPRLSKPYNQEQLSRALAKGLNFPQ